jgi:hypothetical protein
MSSDVVIVCRTCGKSFTVKPSRAAKRPLFCSRLCCYGPGRSVSCEQCGKVFRPQPTATGRFCSHACRWPHRQERERPCRNCAKPFIPKRYRSTGNRGLYCSALCLHGATLAERFARKVNLNGPTPKHMPHLGPCHMWTGSMDSKGYGQIQVDGRLVVAHRVAFFLAHGRWPVPWGLHHCDTPACVRADHIFEGTPADNTADMIAKGRSRGRLSRSKSLSLPE